MSAAEPLSKLRLLPATEDGFFDRLEPEWTFRFLRTGDGRIDRLEVRLPWLPTGVILRRAH